MGRLITAMIIALSLLGCGPEESMRSSVEGRAVDQKLRATLRGRSYSVVRWWPAVDSGIAHGIAVSFWDRALDLGELGLKSLQDEIDQTPARIRKLEQELDAESEIDSPVETPSQEPLAARQRRLDDGRRQVILEQIAQLRTKRNQMAGRIPILADRIEEWRRHRAALAGRTTVRICRLKYRAHDPACGSTDHDSIFVIHDRGRAVFVAEESEFRMLLPSFPE